MTGVEVETFYRIRPFRNISNPSRPDLFSGKVLSKKNILYILNTDISLLWGLQPALVLTSKTGSCHKRQKPQAPIRNRQTRKVAIAKGLNRNTNLT